MWFKFVLIALLVIIVVNLGFALVYMLKDSGTSSRMLKSLTWRIGLSMVLFVLLIVGAQLGWIQPHPGGFE